MPRFAVQTEALSAASAVIAGSEADMDSRRGSARAVAGALDGTPVEPEFIAFMGSLESVLGSTAGSVQALSRAVNEAAAAYALAERTATASME